MFESKYSKLLTGLLIGGIVLIIGVLIFLAVRMVSDNKQNKWDPAEAVEQFQGSKKGNKNDNTTSTNTEAVNPLIGIENTITGDGTSNRKQTKQLYKGYPMDGTIEIPSIDLKYPVLESASKSSMTVSVGILDGPGLNKVGNTTIAGHNYRNGTFFSNLKKVAIGDKVYITDESGTKMTYIVYNMITTSPEDSSFMERDTEGKREVSLDTCTDDSQSRFVVFAREE